MELSRPYTEFLDEQLLAKPGLAIEYLNNAIQSDDHRDFIIALSDVARAYGMSKLASETSLGADQPYIKRYPGMAIRNLPVLLRFWMQ